MRLPSWLKLILAILGCELAGVVGSLFTAPNIPVWYAALNKPVFNPPNWIFAPVWTALFAFMGLAVFLIWQKGSSDKKVKIAVSIFIGQLVLNILWSMIFFGLRSPFYALLEIILLWLAILATIAVFAKISKPAAWLLAPYILWVSFAVYLNFALWQQNFVGKNQSVACVLEAKICPDGSAVVRAGPDCQFAPCPEKTNADFSWARKTDSQTGLTFQYPLDLLTVYLHPVDWPPQLRLTIQPFSCAEGGEEIARAGKTERRQVDNRAYCVTQASEGAAGSIYTNYVYAFPYQNQTAIFTFSLRFVQCANYDEPQQTACLNERSAFDLDAVIDQCARSLRVTD